MEFKSVFTPLDIESIHDDAKERQSTDWRYVQILSVNNEDSVDLIYSYMKDGELQNLVVSDVPRDAHIPSISDLFLEAFVCENEIHDLFGVTFDGLAIDFLGNFYKVSEEFPMTIITPEQLAAKEKAKKIAAAKAAKEAKAASDDKEASEASSDANQDKQAELEAKLVSMPPEKAAKVRAAMEAKAKRQAESSDQGGN